MCEKALPSFGVIFMFLFWFRLIESQLKKTGYMWCKNTLTYFEFKCCKWDFFFYFAVKVLAGLNVSVKYKFRNCVCGRTIVLNTCLVLIFIGLPAVKIDLTWLDSTRLTSTHTDTIVYVLVLKILLRKLYVDNKNAFPTFRFAVIFKVGTFCVFC